MKVAVLTPVFHPYKGGIGSVVANEVRGLRELGCDVDIFTPCYSKNCQEETGLGSKIFRLKARLKLGNAAWIKPELAKLKKYDLVHLHYPFIGGVGTILKYKKQSQKFLVVTYHMDLVATGWRGLFFKIYSRLTLSRLVAAANKIIFSSLDYGQNSFLSSYLKQQPEKFTVIPFGVSFQDFKLDKIGVRKQLIIKETEKVVLFVGALDKAHYFKGLDILFQAAKEVLQKNRLDFKILIVGDGELRRSYENKAQEMGLINQVRFEGRVSDEDLLKYYQAADVLVLPSIGRSEAYGMVLLEAEAAGLPVIASDLPGVREQVSAERGFLFKVGDAQDLARKIFLILEDEKLQQRLGEAGEKWIKSERSLRQEANNLLAVYKSIAH